MIEQNPKQVFKECGTCSQTFAHILNREFGHPREPEELATTALAGGIFKEGHQCGMLWGAILAIGIEAYQRHKNLDEAIATTVTASQHIVDSFINRMTTVNCREIVGYKLNTIHGMVSMMLQTMLKGMDKSTCFQLAEDWAPEAIKAGKEGLKDHIELTNKPVNCAAKVVEAMGGTEEEMVMVSGYAGGLGLSGNACGALSAAIWMKTLKWCKENPAKIPPFFTNKAAKALIKNFKHKTNGEMLCSDITGKNFESIEDHSAYIHSGGCKELIELLSS